MAHEKRYTAKQVTEIVLTKAGELLKKFPKLAKYETENSKKLGYKPSKLGAEEKMPEKTDEAYDVEKQNAAPERRIKEQIDPRKNPKENEEGNNAAPGARPYNTKKYGMEGQVRKSEEKSSKNKFGEHIRQHLVDKVHHSMKQHGYETHEASPNQVSEHARNIGIKDLKGHEVVHASDTYQHEKELKKDGSIQAGIAAAGGGGNMPINPGVVSALGHAFGKSEEGLEKADPLSSIAGDRAKRAEGYKQRGDSKSHEIAVEGMKDSHKKRLQDIKDAPKPNLPKSEEMAKADMPAAKNIGSAKLAKFMMQKSEKRSKS